MTQAPTAWGSPGAGVDSEPQQEEISKEQALLALQKTLTPERLEQACKDAGYPLTLRRQPGYDRGYYFIDIAKGNSVFDIFFEMPGHKTVWWKAIPQGPTQFNVILANG